MKKRHNKKIINTLKVVRDGGDCSILLKFFNGKWIRLAKYLDYLIDNSWIIENDKQLSITDKSIRLLLKTNSK